MNWTFPLPEKQIVACRFPDELSDQLQRIATQEYESKSTIIRRLVRLGLADYRASHPDPRGNEAA